MKFYIGRGITVDVWTQLGRYIKYTIVAHAVSVCKKGVIFILYKFDFWNV